MFSIESKTAGSTKKQNEREKFARKAVYLFGVRKLVCVGIKKP
jgi:hypothetical protein